LEGEKADKLGERDLYQALKERTSAKSPREWVDKPSSEA
jgi:hypothetical protein